VVVLSLQEVVEPAVGKLIVVEMGIANVALADYGVLSGPLVGTVERGRDNRILLVGYLSGGRSLAGTSLASETDAT